MIVLISCASAAATAPSSTAPLLGLTDMHISQDWSNCDTGMFFS